MSVDSLLERVGSDVKNLYQILSVISVSYLCLSCGNFLGYTSTALPSMEEDVDSLFDANLTKHDKSWISGIGPLGASFGSIFAVVPLENFGPRWTILLFGYTAHVLSWAMIAFSNGLGMIFVGRLLGGFGTGIIIPSALLFIVDVVSAKIRGRLGILPQLFMIWGVLISYILGSFLPWRKLALAGCFVAGPSAILLYFAPDNPSWLVSKGKDDEAFEVLKNLVGPVTAETKIRELQKKREMIQQWPKSRLELSMIKPCLVSFSIISIQQLTGINGVTFYALEIFQKASNWNPHIPSIILATTQVIASLTSTFIVERAGRKSLLLVSTGVVCISGCLLGCYFYFAAGLPHLEWLPLFTLMSYVWGFAIGLGPLTWLVVTEILPTEIVHVTNPLLIAYGWFCVFLVTMSFPLLQHEIDIHGIFLMYSAFAAAGFIFVAICVPQTKGNSCQINY